MAARRPASGSARRTSRRSSQGRWRLEASAFLSTSGIAHRSGALTPTANSSIWIRGSPTSSRCTPWRGRMPKRSARRGSSHRPRRSSSLSSGRDSAGAGHPPRHPASQHSALEVATRLQKNNHHCLSHRPLCLLCLVLVNPTLHLSPFDRAKTPEKGSMIKYLHA